VLEQPELLVQREGDERIVGVGAEEVLAVRPGEALAAAVRDAPVREPGREGQEREGDGGRGPGPPPGYRGQDGGRRGADETRREHEERDIPDFNLENLDGREEAHQRQEHRRAGEEGGEGQRPRRRGAPPPQPDDAGQGEDAGARAELP